MVMPSIVGALGGGVAKGMWLRQTTQTDGNRAWDVYSIPQR
jgi:hypothetical protein